MNRGKCSFSGRFGWFFILVLLSLAVPLTANSFVKGDINGDDKIGLPESVYALETTAGLRTFDVVKTLNVPADFETIQAAIDAASEGDTIKVEAGTYNENVSITKDYITLEGAGKGNTIIDGATQDAITIDGAMNATVKEVTVQNGRYGVFARKGALVNLENVDVQDNASDGVRVDENSNARITDCQALRNGSNGIRLFRNSTATLLGTIVASNNSNDGIDLNTTSNLFLYQSSLTANNNSARGIQITGSSSLLSYGNAAINTNSNSDDGVGVFSASSFAVDGNSTLISESNQGEGMSVAGTSRFYLGDTSTLTTKNNNDSGIGITDSSSAELNGVVLSENNVWNGLRVTRSSNALITGTGSLTARGITGDGIGIYISETSTVGIYGKTLIENNEGEYCAGILVARTSNLRIRADNLAVEIRNNKGFGIWIVQQSSGRFYPSVTIHDNTGDGLSLDNNSMVYAEELDIRNNGGRGLFAQDGSSVGCNDSTISGNTAGDVRFEFGVRSKLNGNTIGALPISCDNTVLSRGNHVCP